MNNDHQLDLDEAVELLKAVCADYDLTTEWITPEMMAAQFQAAMGGSAPRDGASTAVTLTQEQFQSFCQTVMNFMAHLGGTTVSDVPLKLRGGRGGASEIEAEADQPVEDHPTPTGKGGCGCFG